MAMYFLCFNGRMVPPLQLEDSLPLMECGEVHAEPAKALDVEASAGRDWRGTQAVDPSSAKLGRAIRPPSF